MSQLISRHKLHWAEKSFVISTVWGAVLLAVGIVVNTLANKYAILTGKNPVTDIVLNNVRIFDVDWIINYSPLLIIIFVFIILMMRPSAIPFTIKSLALFIIIRAGFISLTHLGQFEPQLILPTTGFLNFLGGGNTGGLFFSGHTGAPFLVALIFWDNKILRFGFIAFAIVLGTAMLLAHLHYTIDVVGAFFITPTIFYLAVKFFKKDYRLLIKGLN